jgi:hypothetical protein
MSNTALTGLTCDIDRGGISSPHEHTTLSRVV